MARALPDDFALPTGHVGAVARRELAIFGLTPTAGSSGTPIVAGTDDMALPTGRVGVDARRGLALFVLTPTSGLSAALVAAGAVLTVSATVTPGTPVISVLPPVPAPAATSDVRPTAGYIFPLLPHEILSPTPTTILALCRVEDDGIDAARQAIGAMQRTHLLGDAVGSDLDELATLAGLRRVDGEGDDVLRVRTQVTLHDGPGAITRSGMTTWLTAVMGVAATVDEIGSAQAIMTLYAPPRLPLVAVMPLVRPLAPFGVWLTGRLATQRPRPRPVRLGTVRLNTKRLADTGGLFVPLPG